MDRPELLRPLLPRVPRNAIPDGACDCHTHVFASPDRFPFAYPPSYPVPLAPVDLRLRVADAARLNRGVIVQASPYGSNPDLLLEALTRSNGRIRGIAVADADISEDQVRRLHAAGVRGLRFIENRLPDGSRYSGSVSLTALKEIAPLLAIFSWHVELWSPLATTLSNWDRLAAHGLPVVLDHMGGVNPHLGVNHRHFRSLLALLREGAVWVKLALCRCVSPPGAYAMIRAFHDAIVEANPARLLWGTDWPFVRMNEPPDVADLLDLFVDWVGDPTIVRQILVENPQLRYDFSSFF